MDIDISLASVAVFFLKLVMWFVGQSVIRWAIVGREFVPSDGQKLLYWILLVVWGLVVIMIPINITFS